MSFLMWQRSDDLRLASPRLVMRAAEVPLLQDALALRDAVERLHDTEEQRIVAVAEAAREQARAQGHAAGLHAARDEVAALLTTLAEAAAVDREKLRNDVGALALQVVRKLLGQFADDALLVALATTATDDLLPAQPLALVVHPDLCSAVRERLQGGAIVTDDGPSVSRIEVRGDATCSRDSCRIETEHGSIDASLEAQLARLGAAWNITPATP